MNLTIDNNDGQGVRDYTPYLDVEGLPHSVGCFRDGDVAFGVEFGEIDGHRCDLGKKKVA